MVAGFKSHKANMSATKESRKESRARIALRLMAIKGQGETLERLHRAIEFEIATSSKQIRRAAKSGNEDFIEAITEEECLAVEELLGLAFVAAQSFITSIRTEVVIVAKVYLREFKSTLSFAAHPKAYDALKLAPMLAVPKCSAVEAINAVANYWKHSEEWPLGDKKGGGRLREVWDVSGPQGNKRTVEIVSALGLVPNSSANLRKAAKALGVKEFDDLSPLRQILSGWAAELLKNARAEFGVKA
jgi:hypothetical protein